MPMVRNRFNYVFGERNVRAFGALWHCEVVRWVVFDEIVFICLFEYASDDLTILFDVRGGHSRQFVEAAL